MLFKSLKFSCLNPPWCTSYKSDQISILSLVKSPKKSKMFLASPYLLVKSPRSLQPASHRAGEKGRRPPTFLASSRSPAVLRPGRTAENGVFSIKDRGFEQQKWWFNQQKCLIHQQRSGFNQLKWRLQAQKHGASPLGIEPTGQLDLTRQTCNLEKKCEFNNRENHVFINIRIVIFTQNDKLI